MSREQNMLVRRRETNALIAKPLKQPKKAKPEEDEDDLKFKQKQREDEAIRKAAAAKMKKK